MAVTANPPPTPTHTRDALTLLAMGVTVVLWASAFVAIRAVGHHLDAGALTLGRVAVGSVALAALLLATRARRRPARSGEGAGLPRGRVLILVAVWGVAWFGGYNLTLNAAEQHLDAGTTALLVNLAPMLIAVLAGLLLGEGFPRRLLVGMGLAFGGVVIIAVATSSGRFDSVGVVLGLASALLYAGAATLQKRLLPYLDSLTMTFLGCLAGTVATLPFLPQLVAQVASAPASSVLGIVYLGVFPTAIAFSTWGYVLSRTSAGRTAAATYAAPPIVILMSWVLLDEVPAPASFLGGALALVGVAIATLRGRRPVAQAPEGPAVTKGSLVVRADVER